MSANRDDLLSLALGQLGPQDEQALNAQLDAAPEMMTDYREDLRALHSLPDSLPEAEVPEGAEERLMARLRREQTAEQRARRPEERSAAVPAAQNLRLPPAPARQSRPANWQLMLFSVVAAVTLGALFLRPQAPVDPVSQYAATPGARTQTLGGQSPLGQLIRLPDGRGYLHLNAVAPADRVYQLWRLDAAGQATSAGVFDGQGILLSSLPAGETVAVTVEPLGGSHQPTGQPLLVQKL